MDLPSIYHEYSPRLDCSGPFRTLNEGGGQAGAGAQEEEGAGGGGAVKRKRDVEIVARSCNPPSLRMRNGPEQSYLRQYICEIFLDVSSPSKP